MTDYTAKRVLLKNADGEYLVPFTDKLERDLSDVSAAGTQAILNKVHGDGAVLQYWTEDLTPTAYQTVVIYKTGTTAYFYVNKTGVNTSTPPSSDTTNWEQLAMGAGSANADLSNLTTNGNDKFVTKDTAQTITGPKTMTGTLTLTKTTDANGTANNSPALIVGGAATSGHLELDANEIIAKASGTTGTTLYLNNDGGGNVQIGSGGLNLSNLTASTFISCDANRKLVSASWCTTKGTTSSTASSLHPAVVVTNYRNEDSWYRVWSDDWIEQGGLNSGARTINLLKNFSSSSYCVTACQHQSTQVTASIVQIYERTTNSFKIALSQAGTGYAWYACGY